MFWDQLFVWNRFNVLFQIPVCDTISQVFITPTPLSQNVCNFGAFAPPTKNLNLPPSFYFYTPNPPPPTCIRGKMKDTSRSSDRSFPWQRTISSDPISPAESIIPSVQCHANCPRGEIQDFGQAGVSSSKFGDRKFDHWGADANFSRQKWGQLFVRFSTKSCEGFMCGVRLVFVR